MLGQCFLSFLEAVQGWFCKLVPEIVPCISMHDHGLTAALMRMHRTTWFAEHRLHAQVLAALECLGHLATFEQLANTRYLFYDRVVQLALSVPLLLHVCQASMQGYAHG